MLNSLLLIAAIIGLFYSIKQVRQQPPDKRSKLMIKYALYTTAIVMIFLAVTGRVYWVVGGVAALLPIIQRLFFTGTRLLPLFKYWKNSKTQKENADKKSAEKVFSGKMTVQEAKDILGLDTIENAEQVSKRHKELIQKMHPDRGGSDYLAAQINQAKDILIDHLKT